jgi:hypothetical protein
MLAINLVFLSPSYRGSGAIDPETAGQLGDFVGGFIGQIIALTGLCFLIATFRTEFSRSRHERFETKYLEFLKLHRDNVAEMELQQTRGRRVFVLILDEWRCILNITRSIAQDENQNISQLELLQVAYYVLFYGVGPNSSRMLKASLVGFDKTFISTLINRFEKPFLKEDVRVRCGFPYLPFDGHQSRLGHYYRHLFQMVRYVESNSPIDIRQEQYTRTIRAQLSTHEQALLLLNSLTPMGAEWWNRRLIDRYRLVHNIPASFFEHELELDPTIIFAIDYFEKPVDHLNGFESLNQAFQPFIQLGEIWEDGVAIHDIPPEENLDVEL